MWNETKPYIFLWLACAASTWLFSHLVVQEQVMSMEMTRLETEARELNKRLQIDISLVDIELEETLTRLAHQRSHEGQPESKSL